MKEAGFPQTGERPWYCGGHEIFDDGYTGHDEQCLEKTLLYNYEDHFCESASLVAESIIEVPTLSELIEACGEKLYSLRKQTNQWCVESLMDSNNWFIQEKGSTPEEAVAKLWLALNNHASKPNINS